MIAETNSSPNGTRFLSPFRRLRESAGISVRIAVGLLCVIVVLALFAPLIAMHDPTLIEPVSRLKSMSLDHPMGTDALGRDVFSRVAYGARVSLAIGMTVAFLSVLFGLLIGVVAGYFPLVDSIIMRVMDGLMSIPSILLAIAMVALLGGGFLTVAIAIVIPETPRVVRLVRSTIITSRNEPYVEAAVSLGTPWPKLLIYHLVPNTLAPLIVQGTYILASAMLIEAAMSFLGIGLPPEVPSWGNIMADGRLYFLLSPSLIYFPGILLAVTVLCVNILGDATRDTFDPKLESRT